jgi:hypothetical protein
MGLINGRLRLGAVIAQLCSIGCYRPKAVFTVNQPLTQIQR